MGAESHSQASTRLDQFVDAAFAFAVTLLVIAGDPPSNLPELKTALLNIPGAAGAFALIALFWNAHRSFGRMTPARDGTTLMLSLAVVFTVLVYVFPLRLLTQSLFFWVSGGRLPGAGLIGSWSDLATLYQIYGVGFAVLSALVAALFTRSVALAPTPELRAEVIPDRDAWAICAIAGLVSAAVAALPVQQLPWLPPTMYWLIPASIWARGVWRARKAAKAAAA